MQLWPKAAEIVFRFSPAQRVLPRPVVQGVNARERGRYAREQRGSTLSPSAKEAERDLVGAGHDHGQRARTWDTAAGAGKGCALETCEEVALSVAFFVTDEKYTLERLKTMHLSHENIVVCDEKMLIFQSRSRKPAFNTSTVQSNTLTW